MTRLTLQTLVDRLGTLGPKDITLAGVQQIVGDGALDEATLRPFIGVRTDKYARRLVHRGRWFDVMVLTWAPGQFTPVHNHAGNCGWVRLVRGQISEETFRLVPGASLPDAAVAADPGERGGCVGLERTGSGVIAEIGAVATADRVRAIHRLGNPAAAGGDATVTLHVYSLPHDSCLAFDLDRRTCQRRDLAFDPLPV
ncbi:MAG: cysteine dioxygenase family protein [Planctomycetes bacterium]|nr:cysteine dioxygenase family protein [Planctomycetota bacterium]